ncbi:MAG: polysaccharide-degrading enzyme [bacterium]|jgi:hypothetical protein
MYTLVAKLSILVLLFIMAPLTSAVEYTVGQGMQFAEIEDVPWEALNAGDVVLIHWRAQAYRSKWVLARQGTESQPIVIRGVANEEGVLPVIDGRDAVTRAQLNYWNEERSIIKIGGSNQPADTTPRYIVVESLDIRSARPPYRFTGRDGVSSYNENASGIYIEKGEHITIRNCILRDSGNGLFISHATKDALIEHCFIHDNGIEGSIYHHNVYTAVQGLVYQFNHFGFLRNGCPGNNLKDRSAGLVVRYNWIEGGNRQLDLVDAEDSSAIQRDPRYRSTHVYGNILIEHSGQGNSQVVHYGGDSSNPAQYRKGTLYFFNNTIVSTRAGNTTLFRLSTNDETADCRNNIIYTVPGGSFALMTEEGQLVLEKNWISENWRISHSSFSGTVDGEEHLVEGSSPQFVDEDSQNYHIQSTSPVVDAAVALHPSVEESHPLEWQYVRHQSKEVRPQDNQPDLGALETAEFNHIDDDKYHDAK